MSGPGPGDHVAPGHNTWDHAPPGHSSSGHNTWAWGVEWVWVGGYSAAATTIILLNFMLFISVIRNRYLHYSFNYVVFALSFRLVCLCKNGIETSKMDIIFLEIFVKCSSHYYWYFLPKSANLNILTR